MFSVVNSTGEAESKGAIHFLHACLHLTSDEEMELDAAMVLLVHVVGIVAIGDIYEPSSPFPLCVCVCESQYRRG